MSSTSVRRLKDRGGGGGKVAAMKPSKTMTPISDKNSSENFKKFSGKENPFPRTISMVPAISQKSAMKAVNDEPRSRSSTSSVARGRSASPSEFTRIVSDLKHRVPRGSIDRSAKSSGNVIDRLVLNNSKGMNQSKLSSQQKKVNRVSSSKVSESSLSGLTVARECKDANKISMRLGESSESANYRLVGSCKESELKLEVSDKSFNSVTVLNDFKEVILRSNSVETTISGGLEVSTAIPRSSKVEEVMEKSFHYSKPELDFKKAHNEFDVRSNQSEKKSLNDAKHLEAPKEKGLTEGHVSGHAISKHQSKLHEKLAFLEGKVKRIASDIKRTKEMLDTNNPDASKVILSDIQDKISGIEKAMGHVLGDSDGKVVINRNTEADIGQRQMVENIHPKQEEDTKSLVKGLNSEELEARLFPHHKLLRDRTYLKAAIGCSQNHQPHVEELISESKREDNLLSPIDENPIAQEFLASLSNNQSNVTLRAVNVGTEFCDIQETDDSANLSAKESSGDIDRQGGVDVILTTAEKLSEFDDQETQPMSIEEETEETCIYQLNEIGCRTSTSGWFVSEGESVLLAHDDGSCSFYDITNSEEKTTYKPFNAISPNMWRDCWIIRAPGPDGCSGRYVVAASAGNTIESGFCSWDFYTKGVCAFHIDEGTNTSYNFPYQRTALGPLPNNSMRGRNALSTSLSSDNCQWWYRPCGTLITSTATCQKVVKVYDIRDGEQIMRWNLQKHVLAMDYSSPLQWRNRGKVVIAETEGLSMWDTSSQNPEALLSVSSSGRRISALHVNNTDAELGGGVRQRVNSSEAEGNDGVFCSTDSINILDFRLPSGIGLKIPKIGTNAESVYSRGDSIFLGCTNLKSASKKQSCSQIQQFSMRKQKLISAYALPESSSHVQFSTITQVWGNSNVVMGVCGLGLFVFDVLKDDVLKPFISECNTQTVKDVIGSDDLYLPSFDYSSSRALIISRDRPASWRYLY